MLDLVKPKGNEETLAKEAIKLGYNSLIFLYDKKTKPNLPKTIKSYSAVFVTNEDINKLKTLKKTYDFVVGDGTERALYENKTTDFLIGQEVSEKKDHEHYKRSGMNQVLAKLAAKKKLIFDFSKLLSKDRTSYFGRYQQNAKLARKYDVPVYLFSLATKPIEMRAAHDLAAVTRLLGLSPKKTI